MTNVIHIKDAPDGWKTDDQFVYIGRPGPWGNPFTVQEYGREGCIEMFRAYLDANPFLKELVPDLKGKTLVCYCKPQACHGDVLVALVEGV
jgi:hypothetical protein